MRAIEIFEADIPHTDYGYWISPEGEIFPVPFEGHEDFMQWKHKMDTDAALNKGWIRVISRRHTLNVEVRKMRPTNRGLSMLRRVTSSNDFDNFNVDAFDSFGKESKSFSRPSQFLNYMQQTRA